MNREQLTRDVDLTYDAANVLMTMLNDEYGNRLADKHKKAVLRILASFTQLANHVMDGRYGFGLPAGGGKSSAIVAWCLALHRLNKPYTVAICASKVEELADLKRKMLKHGIPEEWVGLRHEIGKKASLKSQTDEENAERRILLVTHNRVRASRNLNQYQYKGKNRDLVIWDESLLVSESRSIDRTRIKKTLNWLNVSIEDIDESTPIHAAYAYLQKAWDMIDNDLTRQKEEEAKPRRLQLEELNEDELKTYIKSVRTLERSSMDNPSFDPLVTLLDASQAPLRVIPTNQNGGAVIQYEIVVPPEFRRIAVLDASYPIRELQKMDKTIKTDPHFDGNVKSYSHVTFRHLQINSGRTSITKEFLKSDKHRTITREYAEFVKSIPDDKAILFFTMLPRKVRSSTRKLVELDMADILRKDFEAFGIDTTATVEVEEVINGELIKTTKPRFNWLTWGQETATSEYRFCYAAALVGVYQQSESSVAGAIAGQKDELITPISHKEIQDVIRSEITHSQYQAANRICIRDTIKGEAPQGEVLIAYPNESIKDALTDVMPGLQWESWEPVWMKAKLNLTANISNRVIEHLNNLPEDIQKLSTNAVKKALELDGVARRTFTNAVNLTSERVDGWILDKRSFVRTASEFT